MTGKEIIIAGCEFQSDCIEYKDISYLKIMPICAMHELSIACHDKVNKCKYYTLYKQLKQKEQECQELHNKYEQALDEIGKLVPKFDSSDGCDYGDFDCENCSDLDEDTVCAYKLKKVIKGIINKAKGGE